MNSQMNKFYAWSIRLTILSTLWILSSSNAPTFAQILIADPGTSIPTNLDTDVNRQQGRKGLLYQMRFFNPGETDTAFPLDMTTASVRLTIGAGLPLPCTPGFTPASNACTFVVVAGNDDAALDNVKVFFNGDFPANTSVSLEVTGARTTMPAVTQTADVSNPFVVTFTTGNAPLRDPASLQLVFDRSGSMAWPTVPGGGVSRMDTLKTGVQSFFAMLNDYAMLGDKVGVTYFSDNATVFDPPPAGTTNLEPAHDLGQVNLVRGNILTQVPTNGTSIGDGLLKGNGLTALGGDSAPVKRVFLFSDGEQNVAPNVRMTGATLEIVNAANAVVMTYPATTSVCPVTAGRQTAAGFALQQQIAATCGNNNAVVGDLAQTFAPGDLNTYFTQTLASVLMGDKVEHVRNVNGTLPIGTDVDQKFSANKNDVALSILLSWDVRRQGPRVLPFRLKAPDGTEVDVTGNTQRGIGMSFTTIHFPLRRNNTLIPPKGEWTIQLLGSRIDPGTGSSPLDYQLIVMLDNANLASAYRIAAQDVGTGEPIPVQVSLSENGTPLTGATVVAQLLGPADGLGNILSTADTPAGTPNIGGDTLASEAQRKLLLLLADPASASLFAGRNLPAVVLLDNGQPANGDTTANDGIYSGIFSGTTKEGHYKFAVNVQGTTATNGKFQRTQLLTVFVRPKPDPVRTELTLISSATQADGSVIVQLRATPRDGLGNFLGPDLRGNILILSTQGTVQQALSDRLNGSYEIAYRLPSTSSNPNITVVVLGKNVVTKRLSDLGSPFAPGGMKRWAFSLHLGSTFPHGLFGTVLDPGPSFGADLEYRFNSLFSLEAYLGHDRFKDKFFGDSFYITHISGQPKFTFGTGTVRPSVHFGLGAYFPEGGGSNFGGNVGGSIQFWVTPNFAVEPSYNYRIINTGGGSNVKYSTVQGGIRFRF